MNHLTNSLKKFDVISGWFRSLNKKGSFEKKFGIAKKRQKVPFTSLPPVTVAVVAVVVAAVVVVAGTVSIRNLEKA
jgi:hypothetical protein